MNRSDLTNEVYAKLEARGVKNASKTLIETVIKAEEEAKLEALASGEKVQLIGFGTYETRERSARSGRNPQTGEVIDIAASRTIAFKPGSKAKQHLK